MTDVWVCSACHSINRQRDSRCYKCGAKQETAMQGAVADVRLEAAVANRAVRGYRPAWSLALVASVLILFVAGLGVYLVVASFPAIEILKADFAALASGTTHTIDPRLAARIEELATPGFIRALALIVAVVAFALWLSRVVGNVPVLGGGQPSTTPVKALVYPLIPLVNLYKVPGIIQDVLYRVDPRAGGFFMVLLAWFGLVGSWFVDLIGGWVLAGLATSEMLNAGSVADAVRVFDTYVDRAYIVDIVIAAMIAAGALFLVILMLRIELRSAARDREIRAAVLT